MCVQIVRISMLSELIIHIRVHITSLGSWELFSLYETSVRQTVLSVLACEKDNKSNIGHSTRVF